MDTVLDRPWTTESFLAWEDQQVGKHEFDGRHVIEMTGGSIAHQRIGFNLCSVLGRLLMGRPFEVIQEMRLRVDPDVRYPDVVVCPGPLAQTLRTVTEAVAIFEVLSDDTAVIDRLDKLITYGRLPMLQSYVLLEQASIGAALYHRPVGGAWTVSAVTEGAIALPGLDITVPLAEIYQGLTFPA